MRRAGWLLHAARVRYPWLRRFARPCKQHTLWNDDPACVRCGYVFKRSR